MVDGSPVVAATAMGGSFATVALKVGAAVGPITDRLAIEAIGVRGPGLRQCGPGDSRRPPVAHRVNVLAPRRAGTSSSIASWSILDDRRFGTTTTWDREAR